MQYAQWSALFFAFKNGNQKTIDLLIEHNADANLKDQASRV